MRETQRRMIRPCMLCLLVASAVQAETPGVQAETPGVVMLLSEPGGTKTVLVEQRGDARIQLGAVLHARGGIARGALTAEGFAVIAQMTDARDASWSSSLSLLDARGRTTATVDRVAHASKPVVTASGEVLVNRGVAGRVVEPVKGYGAPLRVDALTVEAVSTTGRSRVLFRRDGYLLFVAGATAAEAIVYALGPGSTPLLAVDLSSGAVRTVAPHLELARDFSLSGDSIVFTESAGREQWRVVKLSLKDGARQELTRAQFLPFVPFQLSLGLALNATDGSGLRVGEHALQCVHGPGIDELQATSGKFAAGLHVHDGQMPRVVLFDLERGTSTAVPQTPGLRPEIVGVRP